MSITCDERSGRHRLASRSELPSPATDRAGRVRIAIEQRRTCHGPSVRRADPQSLPRVPHAGKALALLAAMTVAGSRPGRAAAAQADASTCEAGLTDCGGVCVDLQSDMNNCGACGEICESELVPVECRSGVCERANCPVGVDVLRRRRRLPRPLLRSRTLRGLSAALCQRCLQRWRLRRGWRLRGGSDRLRRCLRRYVLQQPAIAVPAATSVRPVRRASRASAGVPAGSAAPRARRSAMARASRPAATTTTAAPAATSARAV